MKIICYLLLMLNKNASKQTHCSGEKKSEIPSHELFKMSESNSIAYNIKIADWPILCC